MASSIVEFAKFISRQNTTTSLQSRHGCVITRGKNIYSYGANNNDMRLLKKSVFSVHAEMSALSSLYRNAKKNGLNNNKSYTFLSTRKKYCEKVGHICS